MGANQTWAKVIGIILLILAVWGFFNGPSILGLFGVNMLHNIVHLLTGAIFAWAGFAAAPVKKVNTWLCVIYAIVGILGFFGVLDVLLGLSVADNWFHLVIGVVSAWIGWKAE